MLGSIVGAGVGALGSIFGGLGAARKLRQVRKNIAAAKAENQRWYDQRYNEDATQRSDAQALLRQTQELMNSIANTKAANANAMADAVTSINKAAEARKAAIENQYMSKKDSLMEQENAALKGEAQNIAQAAQGVGQAAIGAGGAIDELVARRKGEWD